MDYRWKVTYKRGGATVPIFVEAPDEDIAVMRAGMKRSENLNKWYAVGFLCFRTGAKWSRVDTQCLGVIN